MRALVLDAQYCHALAAVRSLGRRGVHVTAASYKAHADGLKSRWCATRLVCPSPNVERDRFTAWLLELLRCERFDAVLFFDEATADIVSTWGVEVKAAAGCLVPERASFVAASRKDQAMRLAQSLGLPLPRTHEIASLEAIGSLAGAVRYPVLVKGVHSSGGQQVALAGDAAALDREVRRIASMRVDQNGSLPIVQEYVPGTGYGLTALVRDGEAVATFMHRRLREHDVARGLRFAHGSTAAESVDEPELLHHGLALLRALRWEGMAMVEFRRDSRDGSFKLLEINPRFVGSLDLAIAAGVDFPWLYAQLAAGHAVRRPARYRVGLRYRWLISKNIAEAFEQPWAFARGILSALRPDTRCDLWLSDPLPHWSQLRDAAWWVRQQVSGATARQSPTR